jgi:preprotein translocase subunit SecA
MAIRKEDMVQRGLNYAIVDEIDSILIDEARTPLIISGRANKSSDLYKQANSFVNRLHSKVIIEEDNKNLEQQEDNENYDYIVDLKAKSASLTQKGIAKAEEFFNVENFNDVDNSEIVHAVNQALKAHGVMKRDIDYIVKDGEVLIVDEFTGRIMYGRRYNEGLHQAIEAKENVKIADESKTLATITFQNYFRMYGKLSGMTGTAMTEEDEFREIYNLDVIEIPTNRPLARKDMSDIIYKNERGKFNAVVQDIKECYEKGQPVLVGTVSIENSEKISRLLQKEGIPHQVLNAKNHEREAEIIAQAGKYKAVTIATNMAGRGTDIMLGGNSEYLAKQTMRKEQYDEAMIDAASAFNETDDKEILVAREKYKSLINKYNEEIKEEKQKVIELGGLKIIGTERHESRRIDNQLRGRSGRQGDPGESRFYLALDDNLLKIFGGDMINSFFEKANVPEDMPIENPMITKQIEFAQSKVEGRNFAIRKHILSYDDVMNIQRDIIYTQRRSVLDGENIRDNIVDMINEACEMVVDTYRQEINEGTLNKEALINEIQMNLNIEDTDELHKDKINPNKLIEELQEKAMAIYTRKEEAFGNDIRELERGILLRVVDLKWMDHIDAMDALKDGIGLRAYGQKDPVVQYRIEGGEMFDEMIAQIKLEVAKFMLHIERGGQKVERKQAANITNANIDRSAIENMNMVSESSPNQPPQNTSSEKRQPIVNNGPKIGRNDPCPCGSGKKYKNCCGKNA